MSGIDCPLCGALLPIIKPSPKKHHSKREGGLWCPHCETAWRCISIPGEGWRATNDISVGPVQHWVLNGHAVQNGD